ncbi:hypothetical protein CLHUN_42530 [Ruminiclostridium hungatei]|uniref:Uncharacterized protein n=1 Tax=Ruminiclostridium hungatei TaxID=48256 RepID=A0A1V4SEE4_RUMHU|nr:hypothetical protein CLHUN_42530 [Ruminiclostridium hungatei]
MWNKVLLSILFLVVGNVICFIRLIVFGSFNLKEFKYFIIVINVGIIIFSILYISGIILK